jgi:hypothetical protein
MYISRMGPEVPEESVAAGPDGASWRAEAYGAMPESRDQLLSDVVTVCRGRGTPRTEEAVIGIVPSTVARVSGSREERPSGGGVVLQPVGNGQQAGAEP